MKVTIVSCVFPPEPVVSAQTSAQIAHALKIHGHCVRVITSFPARPGGKIYPGYRRSLYSSHMDSDEYAITRCFSAPSPQSSTTSRLIENIVFGITSVVYLASCSKPDVIYSNTWPIFASGLMALVAKIRRIPYVVSIQDVYPESFSVQRRAASSSLPYRLMRWIDRWIAVNARHIVVISESFASIYVEDRGVPKERISVVPNWVNDAQADSPNVQGTTIRERFSVPPDAFLVVFGGNIGMAAGVENLIKAFEYTGKTIFALIAGEGSQLDTCRSLAGGVAPGRIHFLSPWSVDLTTPVYQAADLLILPTLGAQSITSVPSKMIGYMLSGRPILATGMADTEMERLIHASGCGWLIPSDDPLALAEKISEIAEMPQSENRQRGHLGRHYALQHLTGDVCLPKIIQVIEGLAK